MGSILMTSMKSAKPTLSTAMIRNLGIFVEKCSYCGLIKRYAMNKFALDNHFTKVATGHNLTDEMYSINVEFFKCGCGINGQSRVLPLKPTWRTLVPWIKPMYFVYEKETILYAFYADVPHIPTECAYVEDSPMVRVKERWNKLNNSVGAICCI